MPVGIAGTDAAWENKPVSSGEENIRNLKILQGLFLQKCWLNVCEVLSI